MAEISPEVFDLEVRRKEDGSWHPCRISLSDDNLDIVVHFESNADKDIISEEKDALGSLRYRSVPLGSGECSNIEEGECVLAMHRGQSRSLFFDAVIIETRRVKHSMRVSCRCLFEIKWLNPEMEENTTTISSNSIRKLARKSITSHVVLDAFLNSLNPATSANGSPPLSLLDETIWGLVEKIEETSKCTGKSTEWADDNFLKAKRVTKGPNNSRRSTRSQTKQEVTIETDKHSEAKQPFISPLAACAALASYMHESSSPKQGHLSPHLEKQNHFSLSLSVSKKHNQEHSLGAASILIKSDASTQDNVSVVSNPTRKAKSSRSPASKRRAPTKSQSSDSQVSRLTRSSVDMAQGSSSNKPNDPVSTTRVTRSLKRKEASDISVRDLSTPEKSESRKKLTPSLVDSDTIASITITAEEELGEIMQKTESSSGMKQKGISSKKPQIRFSPRLRFLPRTRTQNSSLDC